MIDWTWKKFNEGDAIDKSGDVKAAFDFERGDVRVGKLHLHIEGAERCWSWNVDHYDLNEHVEGETSSKERAIAMVEWACAKMAELLEPST